MSDPIANHRRILIVDDNHSIHADFRKILGPNSCDQSSLAQHEAELFGDPPASDASKLHFEIDSAYQGQEGLEYVLAALKEGRPYSMAFVDMRMPPGWDGIETVARIWREYPDLQVAFCTAYSDYSREEILSELGESDRLVILKKPFDNIEALQLAHALSEKWRLLQQSKLKTEELERLVRERTRELNEANTQLHLEMAERARVEEALRHVHKMEAIGQLAGGIAHDFNNILTVIRGYTSQLLTDGRIEPDNQLALHQVDEAAERAANLTRQLLAFSRKQVMHAEHLDLNEVISQVARMLHRVLGEHIALQIDTEPCGVGVKADRAMIEQVVLNLAVNARDAMPKGGKLLISATTVRLDGSQSAQDRRSVSGDFACITVTDTGCGIAPEIMPRLFEPFFTTKEVGKGTGLGLASAYGIAAQHQGWIEVQSTLNQGTTFKVFLPEVKLPAKPVTNSTAAPKARGGKEVILLVEDDEALRKLACKVLECYGYRVITAGSGLEARQAWSAHAAEIDLLLTDMVMPGGMSGRDLGLELQASKPALKVLYSSGYSLELAGCDAASLERIQFLPKPYAPNQLATAIRSCLDGERQQPSANS